LLATLHRIKNTSFGICSVFTCEDEERWEGLGIARNIEGWVCTDKESISAKSE